MQTAALMHLLLAQVDTAKKAADPPGNGAPAAGDSPDWWNTMIQTVQEKGIEIGLNLIAAILIFVIGRWVAQLLTGILRRVFVKAKVDETLQKFLSSLAYSILLALVVLAALQRLGIDTTSFAAIIAAAGLAVGFALQGSLSNFAAGVMLIIFKPFRVGDFITAGSISGTVEAIHIFHTIMKTGDNIRIIVPNNSITSGAITNYSANATRRIDLVVGCGYEDDLKLVRAFLEGLVTGDERILKDPAPVVAVSELADSCVNFVVRPWVASSDYWAVRWDLTEAIKIGFETHGFNIPFPTRDVHLHNAEV